MINNIRLKSEMASKNRLVPKSFLSVIISTIRDFFSYYENVITLPISFYIFLTAYIISLMIFPLMLFGSKEIWGDYSTLSNSLYLFTFFLRLGSIYTKNIQVLISSILILALSIVFLLPLLIFSSIYKVKGRVAKYFCFLTTICTDFLIPIICLWIPSQIGTIVGLLIKPNIDQSNSTFIILLILLIIFFIFLYIFMNDVLFPQVNFTQGRTITWTGSSTLYIYLYAAFILFITRICEIIDDKTIKTILICIYSVFSIIIMIFSCLFLPCINTNFISIFIGGSSASLFVLIFITIKFYINGVESPMLIVLFTLLFLGLVLIFQNIINIREVKVLAYLDHVYQNCIGFNNAFRSPSQFLLCMRIGFKNGHPYALEFDVFDQAVSKWPRSRNVWVQYLRFLAVYFEKKSKLSEVLSAMKEQKFEGAHMKGFRTLLKHVINSRKRHFSLDLKQKFKLLDDQVHATKNLLVTYWSAIEECSSSTAYDIGKQLNELIRNIESMFSHFDLLYPNNASISSKFSNFLSSIVFDLKLAEAWKAKAAQLSDQKHFIFDMTQQFAFEMFPLLPTSLNGQQSEAAVPILEGSFSMTDNKNESQSNISFNMPEHEISGYESSTIRQLALKAPVPFIRNLMILLLCFTLVCFFLGPFVIASFVLHETSHIDPYLKEISTSCRIIELVESISNCVYVEAMKLENVFPTDIEAEAEDDDIVLDLSSMGKNGNSHLILNKIISASNEMNRFNVYATTSIDVDSISSISLFLSRVSYVAHSALPNGSLIHSEAKVTLNEGITALIGDFSQFSSDYAYFHVGFFDEPWFISSIKNSYNVVPHMLDFVFYLCSDVRNLFNNLKTKTLIFTIVFSIISLLFLPAGVFMILNIRKQWNSIIKIINSLPHVAIQKTISHFSHLQTIQSIEQNSKTESKYTNLFIKMISSRNVKNGLSISFLIGLIISYVILSIVVFVALYFIIDAITRKMIFIPYRLFLSENLLTSFNRCSFLILRSLSMSRDKPFCDDTRETLAASLDQIMPKTRDSLNNFLFTENSNYGTGILSSSSEFINMLFDDEGNWMDERFSEEIITRMPRILMFDFIYEIINRLYYKITTFEYTTALNENDKNFEYLAHFVLDRLFENSFKEINDNFEVVMNSMIKSQNIILFMVSVGIFFIGIIFLIIIANQFMKILNTTHFCLSSLSMIDVHFLTDAPGILQLFSGNFDSSNVGKNSLLPSLLKTQDVVDDSIILVNEDFCITSFNKAASLNFNLTDQSIRESRIDAILNFDNPKVLECAAVMLYRTPESDDFSGLKEASFDSRVAAIDSPFPDFLQAVMMRLVGKGSVSNELVILIAKQDEYKKEMREISEIHRNIEELKKSVIPKKLLSEIDIKSSSIKLSVKNAIIVVFDCIYDISNEMANNQEEQEAKEEVPDMKTLFQFCYDALQDMVNEYKDVSFINGFGSEICLCFNLVEQNYILMDSVKEAIAFCLQFFEYCNENWIKVRCGMSYDILSYAGMISTNRLSFDYYGQARIASTRLTWNSKPYTIIFDNNLNDFIPPNYRENLVPIVIDEDGHDNQYMSLSNIHEN